MENETKKRQNEHRTTEATIHRQERTAEQKREEEPKKCCVHLSIILLLRMPATNEQCTYVRLLATSDQIIKRPRQTVWMCLAESENHKEFVGVTHKCTGHIQMWHEMMCVAIRTVQPHWCGSKGERLCAMCHAHLLDREQSQVVCVCGCVLQFDIFYDSISLVRKKKKGIRLDEAMRYSPIFSRSHIWLVVCPPCQLQATLSILHLHFIIHRCLSSHSVDGDDG